MEEEIYFEDIIDDISDDELIHYGTPRHSGRYPWGSGENPYQHSDEFLSRVKTLKKEGLSEQEIMKAMGYESSGIFRSACSIARSKYRDDQIQRIRSLQKDGLSNAEIAEKMGLKGESSVRALLKPEAEHNMKIAKETADYIKGAIDKKGIVDVGVGVERELGISEEKLKTALLILQMQDYKVYAGRVAQATNPGNFTTVRVACPPGTERKEMYNWSDISSLNDYTSKDGGKTFEPSFVYPASMDSKRLAIRYAEDGGKDKDGVIEIRRGVKDLDLGESNYAQVRILVDGERYLKGMAVYSDNLPDGVDVLFNTNKHKDVSKMDVLKKIKNDPENPFGSAIKEVGGQSYYPDPNGNHINPVTGEKESLSLINKRSDAGDWDQWSKKLPSQFLSKQPVKLIKRQLNLSIQEKQDELDEIESLTNPTIKKALLQDFAEDCDAASVHLKAQQLPGQRYQVILPLTSIKEDQVYAPNFPDGTEVALVRYPHGGTFEIPICTVNNRNKEGISVIGNDAPDAIGIDAKVAERLSGADFDGDTVMVIPLTEKTRVRSTQPLKDLIGFDTKDSYQYDEIKTDDKGVEHYYLDGREFKIMNNTQTQMGVISNLITDMTLKGANEEELARAVKHSMVVIDAEKHKLDYQKSEQDNNIKQLKAKYQNKPDGRHGASTLISRAKSEIQVGERKDGAFYAKDNNHLLDVVDEDEKIYVDPKTGKLYGEHDKRTVYVDPNTGEKLYHYTNRFYGKINTNMKDANGLKIKFKNNRIYRKDDDGMYVDVTEDIVTEARNRSNKKINIEDTEVYSKNGSLYRKDNNDNFIKVENTTLEATRAMSKSTQMEEAKDARTLSSGTIQEELYAEYANRLKAMANNARKEAIFVEPIPYSPSARKIYAEQVESLEYKLNEAKLNAPKERIAQIMAQSQIESYLKDDPSLTDEEKRKISQRMLSNARARVGAKKKLINISDKEWEAIQAGAITKTRLEEIITNADKNVLKQLAMPRNTIEISAAKQTRIRTMYNSGKTTAQIADALGVSVSTVLKYTKQ